MTVIAPGTDTSRFAPPSAKRYRRNSSVIDRFLRNQKAVILAICRPEMRKNLSAWSRFGESRELRECANLAIVAGNRDESAAGRGSGRCVEGSAARRRPL